MSDEIHQNDPKSAGDVEVQEPWGHPGPPTVEDMPMDVEERRREATRRQQRMTQDKTGKVD